MRVATVRVLLLVLELTRRLVVGRVIILGMLMAVSRLILILMVGRIIRGIVIWTRLSYRLWFRKFLILVITTLLVWNALCRLNVRLVLCLAFIMWLPLAVEGRLLMPLLSWFGA